MRIGIMSMLRLLRAASIASNCASVGQSSLLVDRLLSGRDASSNENHQNMPCITGGHIVSSDFKLHGHSLFPLIAQEQQTLDLPSETSNEILECGKRGTNYQPSRTKRINSHGMEKRLNTPAGRHMLVRRLLKQKRAKPSVDAFI
jgi:ribosomal protein L34